MNAALMTTLLTCLAPNQEIFTVKVPVVLDDSRFFDEVYQAEATDLHAKNVVVQAQAVEVKGTPILTRTLVGQKLALTLPGSVKVILQHITFVPRGYENAKGTYGSAILPNGVSFPILCKAKFQ